MKLLTVALFVGALALSGDAALRVRYSFCQNHIDTAGPNCNKMKRLAYLREAIVPGIWDNYNATTGFDNVADTDKGGLSSAPYVSAAYWIDSVYEMSLTEKRKNGPLVEGFASTTDLLNPSWELSLDGYVVYAAGHLKFDKAGTYVFKMDFNDAMIVWVDKNGDGNLSLTSTDDALNGTYDAGSSSWNYEGGAETKIKEFPVEISAAGIRKMMLWYWDWGEVGYAMISWKTPGSSEFVPIPPAAFGKRRQFGLPVAHITKIELDGAEVSQSAWSFLEVSGCKKLKFTASADNMLNATPTYIWNFGDGKVAETTSPTIEKVYSEDASVFAFSPSVKVKRDAAVSGASGEVVLIAVASGTGNCSSAILAGSGQIKRGAVTVHDNLVSVPNRAGDVVLFSVYNVSGRRALVRKSADGMLDLSTAKLPAGMYMVNVIRNGSKEASVPIMINAQ